MATAVVTVRNVAPAIAGFTIRNAAGAQINVGAVSSIAHSHAYGAPGQVTIALTVTDDDEGSDVESAVIQLLTPEQAVAAIISMLDTVIGDATAAEVRQALDRARKSLVGNEGARNGVRDKLAEGNTVANYAAAVTRLARESAGAGRGREDADALVEQVAAALAV